MDRKLSQYHFFGDTDIKHSDVVAATDRSVSLTCETTNFTEAQFHWTFYRIGPTKTEAIILYNGVQVHTHYPRVNVTNPTPRSSVLSFRNARLTDAGTYICDIIADAVTERYRTLSSVVEDVPVFNTNVTNGGILVEGDIVQFQCSVDYQGSLDPEVTWHMIEGSKSLDPSCSIPPAQRTTPSKDNVKRIESLLSLKVDSCHSGTRIECSISFAILKRPVNVDRSINGNLISPPLIVISPPKTITFDSLRDAYVPGDVITCSTDGISEPNFEWTDLMSGRVISQDSSLQITDEMSNYSLVILSCTAVLRIANRSYDWRISRSVRFKVTKLNQKGLNSEDLKKVVLFVVILIATLSVAVVIAVSCYVARKLSERKKAQRKLDETYSVCRGLPTESDASSMTRSRHDVIEMEEMAAYATTVIPNSEKNNKKYKSSSSVDSKANASTKGSVDGLTRGTVLPTSDDCTVFQYDSEVVAYAEREFPIEPLPDIQRVTHKSREFPTYTPSDIKTEPNSSQSAFPIYSSVNKSGIHSAASGLHHQQDTGSGGNSQDCESGRASSSMPVYAQVAKKKTKNKNKTERHSNGGHMP